MALERSLPTASATLEQQTPSYPAAVGSLPPGKLLMPEDRFWLEVRRVIVLIPGVAPRSSHLMRLLALLELPPETPIIMAELGDDTRASPSKRKMLAALTAQIQADYPAARQQTLQAATWLDALTIFAQDHDLLVCFAGQHIGSGTFRTKPLNQALFNALNLPTLELAGALPPWPSRVVAWIRRALFDLFPFLVVGLFFWIQLQIGGQVGGWPGKAVLAATVFLEVLLVFVWSLFLS